MTDFMVRFCEKYLTGRSSASFDGLAAQYPEVAITNRNIR